MYLPTHFEEKDLAAPHEGTRQAPFGTLVTVSGAGPAALTVPATMTVD